MTLIYNYIRNMLPWMLIALLLTIIWRYCKIKKLNKQGYKTTACHEIGLALFIMLSVGIASQAVIPGGIFTGNFSWDKQIIGGSHTEIKINLIPLKSIINDIRLAADGRPSNLITNFSGNIIMFIPIGLFVSLLWEKGSFLKSASVCFFVSLFIGLSQLFQNERATDIDDIILNTLGGIIG